MWAGVSSRVSTCRRLPKVLRCNVCAVITKGQTPLKRVRLGVGVSPRVLIAVRANMWCVAFYMPGLRDGSICRG